jgi:hypothetical protein
MKKYFYLTLKIILLTVLYFILFVAGGILFGLQASRDPATQMAALAAMPLVCFVDTLVLSLVILRSNERGWRLMLATAVSYYGVQTVLAQIETAYFGPSLGVSASMLPGLFLTSVPIVLIFVPLAVLFLGKGRGVDPDTRRYQRLSMPVSQWAWKLAVIAVTYVILYFGFGYFVAWQNPNLSAMYGNGANQEVFSYAKLIPLQLARGILWALFALPVIRMSKGSPWQIALMVGVLLALPMNISLVIPNPIMPDPGVRLSHFIETASSNFIFGVFLTRLLLGRADPKHAALPEAQKAQA